MKIWLLIIGIVLLIVSIGIGILQNSEVQFQIGKHYADKSEYEVASRWYFKSGLQGHIEARDTLEFYVDPDINDGEIYLHVMNWKLESLRGNSYMSYNVLKAYSGNADSMEKLGIIYFFGRDVAVDKIESCAWFRVIKTGFVKDDFLNRDYTDVIIYIESQMTPEEIAQSKVLAKEILEKIKANQKATAP